jgi:hypothetical protein
VDQLDFTLPDESAAQQIGFRPFDPEQAGPRLKGKRSA